MRVLALDTTTRLGSVALIDGAGIVEERPGDSSRTHAERLPAELLSLCERHGLRVSAIDLFAVAAGPGSFTGLRIGLATIQGLAIVTRRQIVGVSALEALAQIASRDVAAGSLVAAWIDAQRREVFSALYRVTAAEIFHPGRLIEIEPAAVDGPASTLARWHLSTALGANGATITFVGDGAVVYKDLCAHGDRMRCLAAPLLAGAVGRMAAARARLGEAVEPACIRPLYVRRPDAELGREKKGG